MTKPPNNCVAADGRYLLVLGSVLFAAAERNRWAAPRCERRETGSLVLSVYPVVPGVVGSVVNWFVDRVIAQRVCRVARNGFRRVRRRSPTLRCNGLLILMLSSVKVDRQPLNFAVSWLRNQTLHSSRKSSVAIESTQETRAC
jgi:hypothetical protein